MCRLIKNTRIIWALNGAKINFLTKNIAGDKYIKHY